MRCKCYDCTENTDGYCQASSYVEISEIGECELQCIVNEELLERKDGDI